MCQYGDFEHWRFDDDARPATGCAVLERNAEHSWTIRLYPTAETDYTPWAGVLTAERLTDTLVHLKAISGTFPPGARDDLRRQLKAWGFTRVRWERVGPDGRPQPREYDL